MPEVKELKLGACPCGESRVILAKLRPRLWVAACRSCPTHVYGETEKEAHEKWNEEAAKNGGTGKGN